MFLDVEEGAPAAVRLFLRAGEEAATAVEDTSRLLLGDLDLGFHPGRGAAAGRAGLMASIAICAHREQSLGSSEPSLVTAWDQNSLPGSPACLHALHWNALHWNSRILGASQRCCLGETETGAVTDPR